MICDCTAGTGCVGRGIYNCYDAIMRTTGEDGVRLAEFHLKRIAELEAALREIAAIDYSFRASRLAREALGSAYRCIVCATPLAPPFAPGDTCGVCTKS